MRTTVHDPHEPVVLRSYAFEYQAELDRALLEAAEIPTLILRDTFSVLGHGHGGVRLAVRRDQVELAQAVLDAPPESPGAPHHAPDG